MVVYWDPHPPSTIIACPGKKSDSSVHKNSTILAILSGRPRRLAGELLSHSGGNICEDRRFNDPRGYRIYLDVSSGIIHSGLTGHGHNSAFRCRITREPGKADMGRQGGNVNDFTRSVLYKMRQHRFYTEIFFGRQLFRKIAFV
jgi:hypothetical protein